jgi:hypothetical protein
MIHISFYLYIMYFKRKKPCGPAVAPSGRSVILSGTGGVCVFEWFDCNCAAIFVSYLAFLLLCESIVFFFFLVS